MVEVISAFFFIAVIIFAGFITQIFFEKTKISHFILLMLIGLLAGPLLGIIPAPTILLFKGLTPFFATLALIFLLFEGGLHLNFYKVLRELSRATSFTLMVFVLSVGFTTIITFALGWDLLTGIFFGAVIGGTSSVVVVPLVAKLKSADETRTLLSLESAMTDALCVIVAIAVMQLVISKNIDLQVITQNILGAFAIAAVLGSIFALLWLKLLRDYPSTRQYQYLLTIAVLFILYVVVEFAKGNGAIAALVFGIILGNAMEITKMLRMKESQISVNVKIFQSEISFFIVTFFFVYLGIIFEVQQFSLTLLLVAIALMLALLAARFISTTIFSYFDERIRKDNGIISVMTARGLAAAVLATYPLTLNIPLKPEFMQITQLAFLVILLSNLVTTYGVFAYEKKGGAQTTGKQALEKSQTLTEISIEK
ncbi:MAG: cation:proton antiporter [Candidatus Diapherotrites archaeon]